MKVKEQTSITINMKNFKNTDSIKRIDKSFRTLKEEMDRIVKQKKFDMGFGVVEKSLKELDSEMRGSACLHKNCAGCKSGRCSGIHMISCPCRSCSVWC